ncbi:hypothetical protein D3C80_487910 [compost metagenome]
MLLPQHPKITEQQHLLLPEQLILIQLLQRLPRQPDAAGRHGRTHQPIAGGLSARPQDIQKVFGLFAFEDRVPVGEVDAGQLSMRQGFADGFGLLAIAHQNGDIGGPQGDELTIAFQQTGTLGCSGIKPCLNRRCRGFSGFSQVGGVIDHALGFQLPERQGRLIRPLDLQHIVAPIGLDGVERHRVALVFGGEPKCAARLGFSEPEAVVGRVDHRLGGTKVGSQRVMTASRGLTRLQVGVNVSATEGIDRLFRVADHEQATVIQVVGNAVDGFKDPVLNRIGVLEFIDQSDRVLFANGLGQTLTGRALQGLVKAIEQVVETDFGTPALFFIKTLAHLMQGMQQ